MKKKNIIKTAAIAVVYTVGILSILGSGGRAATFQYWKKPGLSYEDARTAEAACKFEVGMQKFESPVEKQELIRACMEKEGYRMGAYSK